VGSNLLVLAASLTTSRKGRKQSSDSRRPLPECVDGRSEQRPMSERDRLVDARDRMVRAAVQDDPSAVRLLREAIDLDPTLREAYVALGRLYYRNAWLGHLSIKTTVQWLPHSRQVNRLAAAVSRTATRVTCRGTIWPRFMRCTENATEPWQGLSG